MIKKQEIETKARALAEEAAKSVNLEIFDVEYVKEYGEMILRITASGSEGLSLDEATELNNLISDALDKEDFIDDQYFLEVSSPGIERELKTDEDIAKAVGEYICIKTYEKINGQKEWYGDLISYDGNVLQIVANVKGRNVKLEVLKEKISKIRMAIKF